jgi:hypothetical protein
MLHWIKLNILRRYNLLIETMEVKTNADIHDTNISECDKEYSNGSVNKSQHFLEYDRATNLTHRRRKSL